MIGRLLAGIVYVVVGGIACWVLSFFSPQPLHRSLLSRAGFFVPSRTVLKVRRYENTPKTRRTSPRARKGLFCACWRAGVDRSRLSTGQKCGRDDVCVPVFVA